MSDNAHIVALENVLQKSKESCKGGLREWPLLEAYISICDFCYETEDICRLTKHIDEMYNDLGGLLNDKNPRGEDGLLTYNDVFGYITKALDRYADRLGENGRLMHASFYMTISEFYRNGYGLQAESVRQALSYVSQGIKMLEEIFTDENRNNRLMALGYKMLGGAYLELAEFESSPELYHQVLDAYTKALNINEAICTPNDERLYHSHMDMGEIYGLLDDWHKSVQHYKKAQEISNKIEFEDAGQAIQCNELTLLKLGEALINIEQYQDALDQLEYARLSSYANEKSSYTRRIGRAIERAKNGIRRLRKREYMKDVECALSRPELKDALERHDIDELYYLYDEYLENCYDDVYAPADISMLTKELLKRGIDVMGAFKRSIPSGAFAYIDLKDVVIPEGITSIGNNAFEGCINIESITLPASLTTICSEAFPSDISLNYEKSRKIHYNGTIAQWCNISFSGCEANPVQYLDELYIDGKRVGDQLDIPEGVESIKAGAFSSFYWVTRITLPSTLKSIEDWAFSSCNIREIVIPDGVEHIGSFVFSSCDKLESIMFEENSSLKKLSDGTFAGCKALKKIEVPDSVERIERGVFYECDSLEEVIFKKDSRLKYIEAHAFNACKNLSSIVLPASVERISDMAQYMCPNLKEVRYLGTLEQWCSISFESNDGIYNPFCIAERFYIDGKPFEMHLADGQLRIPSTCVKLGDLLFTRRKEIKSIWLPRTLEFIGEHIFTDCDQLTDVYFEGTQDEWHRVQMCVTDDLTQPAYTRMPFGRQRISYHFNEK